MKAKPVDTRARPVVIVATAEGEEVFRWLCVGAGRKEIAKSERQAVVDVQAALFGNEESRVENRRAAMRCVTNAALEANDS